MKSTQTFLAITLGASFSLSGCAGLQRMLHNVFGSDQVHFERPMPAEADLPGVKTVAVSSLEGKKEDVEPIGGWLGEWLSGAHRFQVVERDRLEAIAKENGCTDIGQVNCLAKSLPASALIVGSVSQSRYNENVVRSQPFDCYRGNAPAKCVTNTRSGAADVVLNLRLVEVATGFRRWCRRPRPRRRRRKTRCRPRSTARPSSRRPVETV